MEHFFKRWFWTVNVLAVAVAGVVTARTVSAVAATRLSPPPAAQAPQPDRARPVGAPIAATVDGQALASIFGMALPEVEAEELEPDLPPPGSEVPSQLNATLMATIEADPERYSLAVISDNASRAAGVYGVGDTLLDTAEVIRVERRRVLVNNGGRTEYLEMSGDQQPAPPTVTAAAPTPSAPPPAQGDDGIRKVGDNEYVVSQTEIDNTLSNLNSIATQARIVPAFKNGVAQGFKLFSIRPGSLYAKIGIQNGDVVKKINGYDLNSPDKALEIYQKLKDAQRVEVELERRGQTLKKSYEIQ